ncbi:MAG: response regulator transcription factor [Chloroflexota bacterium]|nr:response regulator transcription factor [Chloroflexota bacterium]
MNAVRVLLAEDHHLVRQGLRALLERDSDIEVVGEAADGLEALHLIEEIQPDVVVMDITMPGLNGLEVLRRVRQRLPEVRVLMLSVHEGGAYVLRALQAGASGYLLKRSLSAELLLAIRAAQRGEVFLSPAVSQIIITRVLQGISPEEGKTPYDRLTPREREVFQLIAEGYTNQAIAHRLTISVRTVETHRAHLMDKLDIHDVAGLTRLAIQLGLVESVG